MDGAVSGLGGAPTDGEVDRPAVAVLYNSAEPRRMLGRYPFVFMGSLELGTILAPSMAVDRGRC